MASDRILPLCELLLGAAYADKELKDQEKDEVRSLLEVRQPFELHAGTGSRGQMYDGSTGGAVAARSHSILAIEMGRIIVTSSGRTMVRARSGASGR